MTVAGTLGYIEAVSPPVAARLADAGDCAGCIVFGVTAEELNASGASEGSVPPALVEIMKQAFRGNNAVVEALSFVASASGFEERGFRDAALVWVEALDWSSLQLTDTGQGFQQGVSDHEVRLPGFSSCQFGAARRLQNGRAALVITLSGGGHSESSLARPDAVESLSVAPRAAAASTPPARRRAGTWCFARSEDLL